MTGFFCTKKWITKKTYPFTFTEFKIGDIFWTFALSDGLDSDREAGLHRWDAAKPPSEPWRARSGR
jgi:hypothetical protein